MKTAAVIIDSWKLAIFKKHLEAAGYSFSDLPGLIEGTLTLQVPYEWAIELKQAVEAANEECRLNKPQ